MTTRLLLDAFSCGGMAADGYAAAGWEVVALDNDRRALRHNPHPSILGDAMRYLGDTGFLRQFDAIHASPPCQLFSDTRSLATAQGRGFGKAVDLLTPTLEALSATDVPWVVENVPRSPLRGREGAVTLCGSSWGLGVQRHRLFLPSPGLRLEGSVCDHSRFPLSERSGKPAPWGVYYNKGEGHAGHGRIVTTDAQGHEVMGMTRRSLPWRYLKEGLPPVYTEYIGRQMLAALGHA